MRVLPDRQTDAQRAVWFTVDSEAEGGSQHGVIPKLCQSTNYQEKERELAHEHRRTTVRRLGITDGRQQ